MEINKIKLIAMDLDGTLTQHKEKLSPKHRDILNKLAEKYNNMASELDAQLFVCDNETKNLVIDTVHSTLGNISFLKELYD